MAVDREPLSVGLRRDEKSVGQPGRVPPGPIHHVTLGCRNIEAASLFYETVLGYQRCDGPKGPGTPEFIDLRCPDDTLGALHLVPVSARVPAAEPHSRRGWSTLEFVVSDCAAMAQKIGALPEVVVISSRRKAGQGGNLEVFHILGPDGVVLYLTQILPADRPYDLPSPPEGLVGRLFIAVWSTPLLESDRLWFEANLSVRRISDRTARLSAVSWARGCDPSTDHGYRISSLYTGGGSLIEVDQLEWLDPGFRGAPRFLPGIQSVSFQPNVTDSVSPADFGAPARQLTITTSREILWTA